MGDDYEGQSDHGSQEGGPVKTFLEHLEDLRWVLIKSAAALGVSMLLCLIAGNYVVQAIKWPLDRAKLRTPGTNQVVSVQFGTNRLGTFPLSPEQQSAFNLGTNRFVAVTLEPVVVGTNLLLGWKAEADPNLEVSLAKLKIELINLSPVGGFFVAFQVAIYGGLVLAAPFIFYFVISFVFPALKMHERKHVRVGLCVGGLLFLAGVSFCYFILAPLALSASQSYSEWLGFSATQWRAEDYISFVCKFMIGMGLGFQMPVVILTLVKIGVLDYSMLSKGRRYMIVINLFLGAILTTPEVLTQVMMFLPLQFLYEISIWIAWYWERRDRKREAAAAAQR
ncbi:MAG TPA: twin-arginine translocase subunit TatC [Verrucomicrobiota bacterium]|nr:twin-arginine translocase subunit TatC [Verrucomicrobiota bacterium]